MDFKTFNTGSNDSGRRIDKVIRKFLPEIPLSNIYKLIRKGLIKVNNKKINQDYKIVEKDIIYIPEFIITDLSNNTEIQNSSKTQALPEVVFKNEHIIIFNKPYDMLVHGSSDSLDIIVQEHYKKNTNDNSLSFTPGPLHRIDRKTTGLITFSQSIEGARWFSKNIQSHSIQKKYYGIIEGNLKETEIWQDFIERNNTPQNFYKVTANFEKNNSESKEAYTEVTPFKHGTFKGKPVTLVIFDIKTGRTHQIRSQCGLHKHPLLGDTAYGGKKTSGTISHFLQAFLLKIPKNDLKLPETIEIPLNIEILKQFSSELSEQFK